eukprot:357776-Amphidinium_carterae.1
MCACKDTVKVGGCCGMCKKAAHANFRGDHTTTDPFHKCQTSGSHQHPFQVNALHWPQSSSHFRVGADWDVCESHIIMIMSFGGNPLKQDETKTLDPCNHHKCTAISSTSQESHTCLVWPYTQVLGVAGCFECI